MEEHAGLGQFLQCCPEGADDRRRELSDETDGIAQEYHAPLRQDKTPRGRVQSGEEPVFSGDIRSAERIQQRALASIGVPHQGHHRDTALPSPLAVESALRPDLLDLLVQAVYPPPDKASISFQLRFAWPPGADPAAKPLQMAPLSGKARQEILVLCQLHLELPLPGSGTPGEDVQDQPRTVYHFDV